MQSRYKPILETKALLSKNVHFHILLPTLNFCLKLNDITHSKKHSKEKSFTKVERRDSKYQGEQTYKVTFFFVSVVFFSSCCIAAARRKTRLNFPNFYASSAQNTISSLVSVRLWNFKDGGSWKVSFLAKNQHTTKDFFFFKSYEECQFVKNWP